MEVLGVKRKEPSKHIGGGKCHFALVFKGGIHLKCTQPSLFKDLGCRFKRPLNFKAILDVLNIFDGQCYTYRPRSMTMFSVHMIECMIMARPTALSKLVYGYSKLILQCKTL